MRGRRSGRRPETRAEFAAFRRRPAVGDDARTSHSARPRRTRRGGQREQDSIRRRQRRVVVERRFRFLPADGDDGRPTSRVPSDQGGRDLSRTDARWKVGGDEAVQVANPAACLRPRGR